jgi:hypothetical protein
MRVLARSCRRTHSSPVSRRAGRSTVRVQFPDQPGVALWHELGWNADADDAAAKALAVACFRPAASTVALTLALGSRRKIERGSPPGDETQQRAIGGRLRGAALVTPRRSGGTRARGMPGVGALRLAPLPTSCPPPGDALTPLSGVMQALNPGRSMPRSERPNGPHCAGPLSPWRAPRA